MIIIEIPADIYEAAARKATLFHSADTREWFDVRDEIATAMAVERQFCIDRLKDIASAELSLLYRTAYSQHVRSVLSMGENDIPPSIHFAAAEFAASEIKARLIDAIETAAPSKAKQAEDTR